MIAKGRRIAAASFVLAVLGGSQSSLASEENVFQCGRDWMTVRHAGMIPEDFEPGEIVTFRKSDVIEARQYRTLNAEGFGEPPLRIYLAPNDRAKKGRPDRLLLASREILPLVRKCLIDDR